MNDESPRSTGPAEVRADTSNARLPARAGGWKKKFLVVCAVILGCCGVTAAATAWWVKRNVYASPFQPVSLNASEQAALDQKVEALREAADGKTPEQRAEEERRTLVLTEKEINSFLAREGLGEQFKVRFGNGDVAVTVLAPFEPDVPVLGGKTLRVQVAVAVNMNPDRQFALSVKDVSIGGVPIPNAWMGDIKGVNVLENAAESEPVVKQFLAGIKEFEIHSGAMRVLLND